MKQFIQKWICSLSGALPLERAFPLPFSFCVYVWIFTGETTTTTSTNHRGECAKIQRMRWNWRLHFGITLCNNNNNNKKHLPAYRCFHRHDMKLVRLAFFFTLQLRRLHCCF